MNTLCQPQKPQPAAALTRRIRTALLSLYLAMFTAVTVFAAPETITDTKGSDAWTSVVNFITPWIGRLGGMVLFVGVIMFALAFKNEDADAKTRGIQTIIAGAIVVAVSASSAIFLK